MTELRLTIHGHPHPQGRGRASVSKTGSPYIRMPAANGPAQTYVGNECRRQAAEQGVRLPLAGRLEVRIAAYTCVKHDAAKPPDADNLAKTVLDGLNKIAYEDDSQIDVLLVHVHRGVPKAEERTLVAVIVKEG